MGWASEPGGGSRYCNFTLKKTQDSWSAGTGILGVPHMVAEVQEVGEQPGSNVSVAFSTFILYEGLGPGTCHLLIHRIVVIQQLFPAGRSQHCIVHMIVN